MTVIAVNPSGEPGAADVNGLAWKNLTNVNDVDGQAFIDRFVIPGAGVSGPFGIYLGAAKYLALGLDATNTTDSTAAIEACVADANALRCAIYCPPGVFKLRPSAAILLMNGVSIIGADGAFTLNYTDDFTDLDPRAGTATVFAIPYNASLNDVPIFSLHRGSAILNWPVFWYPDQVARYNNGDYTIDVSSYPVINGEPDEYAPTLITDHVHADSGATLVGGRNANLFTVRAIMLGADTCGFFADGDPNVEPWCAPYSTGTGKGVSGFDVYLKGFPIRRGVVIERCGVLATLRLDFTPGFWTEASQMNLGEADSQPIIKWSQRNLKFIQAGRKWTGSDTIVRGRQARYGLYCQAGQAFAGAAHGAGGIDSGKFANHIMDLRLEAVPTRIYVKNDAFLHGNQIKLKGHAHDNNDSACVENDLDIRTNASLAGSINSDDVFRTMADQGSFWSNVIYSDEQEITGRLFENTANDLGTWVFRGPRANFWGGGSKLTLSLIKNASANVIIDLGIDLYHAGDGSCKRVLDVVDDTEGEGQKVFVRAGQMRGVTTLMIGNADWAGSDDGVMIDPVAVTGEDEDDGEDGS